MASRLSGWDSSEVSPPNTKREELTHATKKVLNFEMVRNKGETAENGHSVVGLQKENMLEEPEVTSPIKPNMDSSTHDEEGYLDMGYNKDVRPKAEGRWEKLAREKGPVGDAIMMGQQKELVLTGWESWRTWKQRKIEKLRGNMGKALRKRR